MVEKVNDSFKNLVKREREKKIQEVIGNWKMGKGMESWRRPNYRNYLEERQIEIHQPSLPLKTSRFGLTGTDKVRERGAPSPGNDKENWGNHHIDVFRYEEELSFENLAPEEKNRFIHPWLATCLIMCEVAICNSQVTMNYISLKTGSSSLLNAKYGICFLLRSFR